MKGVRAVFLESGCVGLLILAVGLLVASCSSERSSNPALKSNSASYVLPTELFLKFMVRRGAEGEVYIDGSTNLPEGLKVNFEVAAAGKEPAPSGTVIVRNGEFRSAGLMAASRNPHYRPAMKGWPEAGNSKYVDVPFPPGKRKVHFTAYFNSAVQSAEVLKVTGDGGRNLTGPMFKKTDPEVVDSGRMLDYSQVVQLAPRTPEAEAINLVKRAVLTVPGMGKSSTDIGQNIQLYMTMPGYHPGKGWSAKLTTDHVYAVSFDLVTDDNQREHQAMWSANLATRRVTYVNMAAKYLSWTPNY
jgi:hypothetical protein